ncbi:MAG: DUF1844 domain-containing protein [Candidatus Acidiferrales bacterium]
MAEHKHDESFKVVDRRPFTAEGELRKEAVDEERRERESAKILSEKQSAKPEATPAAGKVISGPEGTAAPGAAAGGAAVAGAAPAPEGPAPSRNFQMLVDFLARNAAAMLGGMTDPRTGQAFLDLEGAHEMIDLLDVLREKTQGNLAAEDNALLVEVIGSLKLSFMEITNAAAAQAQAKGGAKSIKKP